MAFYNGNFSTFASLKTSVEAALALEGWTDSSGVYSKNGMFVKLTATATELLLQAGTGASAGTLTGTAPQGVKLMSSNSNPITFPADYDLHIFTDTDEIYLIVNFNAVYYQQLSWGKSQVEQIGGSGMWVTGSYRQEVLTTTAAPARLSANFASIGFYRDNNYDGLSGGLFFEAPISETYYMSGSFVHTGLDTETWKAVAFTGVGQLYGSGSIMAALLQSLPSMFNQNTVLLPIMTAQRRNSKGLTVVADLVHARLCRNDNQLPEEIVEYGPDRWKVYPFYQKNLEARNGGTAGSTLHSGTFGFAIRYTGP